jgi:ABC-type multidrug transport system ATPase subunit
MQPVVVENITKKYVARKHEIQALQGISFSVERGEIFGIIGPDGAGKTSLFRILTTLILADSGNAWVDGFEVVSHFRDIRKRVGYMPGRFSLYQDLTVSENLEFFATIFSTSIQKNYDLIKDIYQQIEPFRDRRAGQLSGGMKQKLALCCALIHKPSVLFLDEPTTGVDAVSRKEFWEMLHRLKDQGITIVVSTAYMDEAGLCDRVALIQKGSLLSVNTPAGVIEGFRRPLWAVRANPMYNLLLDIQQLPAVESCYPFGQFHHVVFREESGGREILDRLIREKNYGPAEIQPIRPNIEDCFMALMKE